MDLAQVAFVPNRWINENIVLAREIVHSFKHTGKKKGFLGIKLDFQKAYDRMELTFLLEVLRVFGFNSTFVNLIHQCLSLVEFSLLLNGVNVQVSPTPEALGKVTQYHLICLF